MSSRVAELLKRAIEREPLTPAEQGAFPYDVVLQTLEYLTEEYAGSNVQHLRISFDRVSMRQGYIFANVKLVMTSDFPPITDSTCELLERLGWEFKVKPNLDHSEFLLLMWWNHERVS